LIENKAKTLIIAIILLMSTFLVLNQSTNAQTLAPIQPSGGALPANANPSITIETLPYLSFTPNPIGVGQALLVNVWMHPPINVQRQFIDAFEVTITEPDGHKQVVELESYAGDATAWFEYVPKQAGNYTLKFNFLGMYYPDGRYLEGKIINATSGGQVLGSAYYKPSETQEQPLTVQEQWVQSWPASPLPADYWTRPVSPEHREWWTILGNYPATGYRGGGPIWDELYPNTNPAWSSQYNFVPYVQAPNTAHVVWKRQGEIGGLFGGVMGPVSLRPNPGYPSIVYSGRCYEVVNKPFDGITQNVWQCYDLRTGEIYWEKTGITQVPTAITYTERTSQAVAGENSMMRGLTAQLLYIGGGRLIKYNPWNGAVALNVSISPLTTGTYFMHEFALSVQDLGSNVSAANRYRLINWSTNDVGYEGIITPSTISAGVAQGLVDRIASNISWPMSNLPTTIDYTAGVAVFASALNPPNPSGTGVAIGQRLIGVNINTGSVMWNVTVEDPGGHEQFFSTITCVADNGKYVARMNSGEVRAWDLRTGQLAWSTPLEYPWGVFGAYHVQSAYGLYFCGGYDGVHAINYTNGNIEWTFNAYTPYQFETPYQGEYAFHVGGQVADGKLYISSAEHTPSQPETRGLKLYCLDALTGQQYWNFSGSQLDQSRTFTGAIADGYLAFASQYDSTMYVFGKGKTQTTIEAPLTAITKGQRLIVKGTVMDQSPGQPNTPAVSKESMSVWMEHLHMQTAIPANVIGVPVSLDTVDPNGNYIHIADVVSDMSGTYSYLWTPENPGKYTVTATFMGDDSYSSSYAETAIGVVEATQATATPAPVNFDSSNNNVMMGLAGATIAIIIAIAIVGILILRKHP
jgi:hypothetical protein